MNEAVVDASVAVKWLVDQPDTQSALSVLDRFVLIAPDLIFAEISNALWKYQRAGILGGDVAAAALDGLGELYFKSVALNENMSRQALEIAVALSHPVYDCYYLALSKQVKGPLITDDRKLAQAAVKGGYDIIRLSDLPEHQP